MSQPYSRRFFFEQSAGSLQSARAVVPHVMRLVNPATVVDVGCGVGTWAAVFAEHGATVTGIDGDYVDRKQLRIPDDRYLAADLAREIPATERFDLAVSLEVGEHLPPQRSAGFVRDLVRLAPAVLFSAAIPHQTGTAHIAERWQSEWAAMFASEGYEPVDVIRPAVWDAADVDYWYVQNTILYARAGHDLPAGSGWPLDLIHPRMYEVQHSQGVGLGQWSKALPREARFTVSRSARRLKARALG
jgi:SAM-dependent methyltransferase